MWLGWTPSTAYAQNIHIWGKEPEETYKIAQLIPNQQLEPQSHTLQDIVCSYNWDCDKALRIMRCESTNNPRASASNNYGLFQINAIHVGMTPNHQLEDLYDPEINIRIAYELYQSRGWQPWLVCGGGS